MNTKLLIISLFMPLVASAQPKGWDNTVAFVHDPVMAYEDGTYYLFSTGRNIQLMTSKDCKTWTRPEEALPFTPQWAQDSVPGFRDHMWAPDVIAWHGKWWMAYSCSTFGKNTSAIGLASTSSLAAHHWDDQGCIVNSHRNDSYNAIDPSLAVDDDDNLWMAYGSFWDGIQLIRLKSVKRPYNEGGEAITWLKGYEENIVRDNSFRQTTIARRYGKNTPKDASNPTSQYAGVNAIEAPFIFKHDGWYYLFVSWDYCCRGEKSTYRTVVGRSKNIYGPYLDENGVDMAQGGGTLVIEGDKKKYEAAGHSAAYRFGGKDIFICHGYNLEHHGASTLIQREMEWKDNGFPTLKQP